MHVSTSRALLAGLAVAALLSGCGLFDSTPNKRVAAPLSEFKPQLNARVAWSQSIGRSGAYALAPAVAGSAVVAAATGGDVHAFEAATGKALWRADAKFPISSGVAADANVAVVGGPDGQVAAFAVGDGKPLWNVTLPGEMLGKPVIAQGLVVMRTSDARLFGLDAATGERRWALQRPLPALVLRSDAGLAAVGDVVYASFPGGRLLGVTVRTGAVRTDSAIAFPKGTTELERVADVVGTPAAADDLVCASAYQGRIGCVSTANGGTVWARNFSAAVGPSLDARFVFGVDEASVVQAFARGTGAVLWSVDRYRYRDLSAPVSWGRVVATGDYRGYVHLLSRDDGADFARVSTDGNPVRATPVLFEQGGTSRLIVQTAGGGLYAISAE